MCDAQLGCQYYLTIDAGPIYSADGELIAVVETLRDMTEQKQAQIALERLASHDGLTGIANRRRFDEKLGQEWLRARRDKTPLALLMLDVDHFKLFNDRYGHQAGDDCLRRIAECLASMVARPGDLVARYGGEEFAVVLPSIDVDGALVVAQRMREAVRPWPYPMRTAPSAWLRSASEWPVVRPKWESTLTACSRSPTPRCTRPNTQGATVPR